MFTQKPCPMDNRDGAKIISKECPLAVIMPAMSSAPQTQSTANATDALKRIPHDELLLLGRALGLDLSDDLPSDELVRRVSARRHMLTDIDREGLLEVLRWSRRSLSDNATNEDIAREIVKTDKTNYDALSRRALVTLCLLRDIKIADSDAADDLIEKIKKRLGFWQRFHRKRRSVVGSWLSRIIEGEESLEPPQPLDVATPATLSDANSAKTAAKATLRRQIEDMGVVGGIAHRIRSTADDYIKIKLDEIEARIDLKLNEIDQRLAEWRDREVANRLKILRITLGFTVLVAVLSLAYNYAKKQVTPESDKSTTPAEVRSE